jgi:hypothetical protein
MRDDNFERQLETALTKYAAVEPRPGLEQRVLANLRADREHGLEPAWWTWPVAVLAGLAGAILCAVALRHGAKTKQFARVPTMEARSERAPVVSGTEAYKGNLKSQISDFKERQKHGTKIRVERTLADDLPKLEQFPAPEPLTEQEKSLIRFAQEDAVDAALVAEARAEQLQQQRDEMKAMGFNVDSERQDR